MTATAARSKAPKYFAIAQDILRAIRGGRLPPGGQIPSENEIIETYGVSNTTARKALLELERGGWVRRVRGKGTYVREKMIERPVSRILSFTRNMIEEGREPSTQLIGLHMLHPSRRITLRRRRYTLEGPVCKIQRLRLADGVPLMFETRYISTRFCPGLNKHDLEGSLYEIYQNAYGLSLRAIVQELGVAMPKRALLETFGLEKPVPFFRVDGVTLCGKDLVLEMEESHYRGDRYRFSVAAAQEGEGGEAL